MDLPYFVNNPFFVPVAVASFIVLVSLITCMYCALTPKSGRNQALAAEVIREKITFLKSILDSDAIQDCDLSSASRAVNDAYIWRLVRTHPGITSLNVTGASITDTGLFHISGEKFPNGQIPCSTCGRLFVAETDDEEFCSDRCEDLSHVMTTSEADANTATAKEQQVSDRCSLQHLQKLNLTFCNISAEGLQTLTRLPELSTIILTKCPVGDEEAEIVAKIPTLEVVVVSDTTIDLHGVQALASLPGLRVLDLSKTDIEDDALAALHTCNTLQELKCSETMISSAGLQKLQQALPSLNIHHDGVFAEGHNHEDDE